MSSRRRRGANRPSDSTAGSASLSRTDSNPAMRARPAIVPAAAARSASAIAARSSSASAWRDQDQRGVREPHPSAGALEQLHAGLAFQHRELLGDGRGRELKRVRHRRDRASLVQLAQ